jgi:thiamine pyrophosphate-dependent acetolactate synthase large subunit-like protein
VTEKFHLTGAQAIVATLRSYGVETIFGIPGVHTLPIYDVIRGESGLRHILARHEQGAGFMAEGYARASGRPGVVCTITGPGVTNVATPVASAYADSVPLFVISSGLPRASKGRARGELHELKDQHGVMEALAGWTRVVEYVEEIPEAIRDAWRIMLSGRPRGAYLQVPLDLLEESAEVEIPALPEAAPPRPDGEKIILATRLLHEAHRPLIVAGAGVTAAGANALLAELAELLQAPVLLGSKSHDVLPTDNPLVIASGGHVPSELRALMARCDATLVVGSKLGAERTGDEHLALPAPLIRIDIDPSEIERSYPASVGIVSDARLALAALLKALRDLSHTAEYGSAVIIEEVAQVNAVLSSRTRRVFGESVALLNAVREGLPRDGSVIADMTMLGYASEQYFPVYEPRTYIHPSELCTIGCGLPLALGAKVAAPERPVVALCGDGGFLLNTGELATAAQERIPVVIVLFNDSTYTAVKSSQRRRFNERYIATDLLAPDYVALAQAFHLNAMRAETPAALRDAIQSALAATTATLIEVPLPPVS